MASLLATEAGGPTDDEITSGATRNLFVQFSDGDLRVTGRSREYFDALAKALMQDYLMAPHAKCQRVQLELMLAYKEQCGACFALKNITPSPDVAERGLCLYLLFLGKSASNALLATRL